MHIQVLSVLFLFESLLSCGTSQEKITLREANLGGNSSPVCQTDSEKSGPATSNIIFQSSDFGQTWTDASAGLPGSVSFGRVLVNNGEIVLASGGKLYRSSNNQGGVPAWTDQNLQNIDPLQNIEITGIYASKTGIYASSYRNGFYKEVPGAQFWLPMHNALSERTVRSVLELSDGTLFIGMENGLFKSTDDGASWKHLFEDMGVNSLAIGNTAETTLICGTYEGLRRSTDGGEHWEPVLTEDKGAWQTKRFKDGIVTITEGGSWKDGVHPNRLRLSIDEGKTWQRVDEGFAQLNFMYDAEVSGPPVLRIHSIEQLGDYLFCSNNAGIFRSSNMGKTWEMVRPSDGKDMFELLVSGNRIYAVKIVGC